MSDVAAWSREDVCSFLERLGLPEELQLAFRRNAVDGSDLVGLTDADLVNELGCTHLQARKIRSHLTQLGVTPPVGSESAVDSIPATTPQAAPPLQQCAEQEQRAAETETPPCFQPEDLQQYQQLTKAVANLEGLQPAAHAAEATTHLKHVEERLGVAESALPPLQKALRKEHKRIAKYSGQRFSLTGLFTTKKHKEAKLVESEARAAELTQQVKACEVGIAAAQSERDEAQRQVAAWQGTLAELSSTQQQLSEHVEHIFAAPAWRAWPRHAELEAALAALAAQAAESARGVDTYGRGAKLLSDAERLLQDALQNLSQTQMFTMMDMATDPGPGRAPDHLLEDFWEMTLIQQAEDEVRRAAQKTAEARALLPGLPAVDERVLGAAKTGLFQNFLFGGFGSDMVELALVAKSKREVGLLQQQVCAAAGWAQSNLAVYRQQDAALKEQAAAKKGELDAFRRAALEAALTAGA